jgi:hypothetical protein
MSRMKRSAWILILVVLVLGIVAWVVFRSKSNNVAVDLIAQFPSAVQKRPTPDIFSIIDATLAGQTKRAIAVDQASRVAWTVTVPDNAALSVSAGIQEKGWTIPGDGVLFRVSINDDELLSVMINPYGEPKDRQWHDYTFDLSEYAGEKVDVFLKTNAGPPGHDDRNGDFAVWGNPRIIRK